MLTSLISNFDVSLKLFRRDPGQLQRQSAQVSPHRAQSGCPGFLCPFGRDPVHPGVPVLPGTSGDALEQHPHPHVQRLLPLARAGWHWHPIPNAGYTFPVGCAQSLAGSAVCALQQQSIFSPSSTQLHLCFSTSEMPPKASVCGLRNLGRLSRSQQSSQEQILERGTQLDWAALLLRACEPKGRESGHAPAF